MHISLTLRRVAIFIFFQEHYAYRCKCNLLMNLKPGEPEGKCIYTERNKTDLLKRKQKMFPFFDALVG
jgi:hypothetical protein